MLFTELVWPSVLFLASLSLALVKNLNIFFVQNMGTKMNDTISSLIIVLYFECDIWLCNICRICG